MKPIQFSLNFKMLSNIFTAELYQIRICLMIAKSADPHQFQQNNFVVIASHLDAEFHDDVHHHSFRVDSAM